MSCYRVAVLLFHFSFISFYTDVVLRLRPCLLKSKFISFVLIFTICFRLKFKVSVWVSPQLTVENWQPCLKAKSGPARRRKLAFKLCFWVSLTQRGQNCLSFSWQKGDRSRVKARLWLLLWQHSPGFTVILTFMDNYCKRELVRKKCFLQKTRGWEHPAGVDSGWLLTNLFFLLLCSL